MSTDNLILRIKFDSKDHLVPDPVRTIATIRSLTAKLVATVLLVCEAPASVEQENYIRLFEEFSPQIKRPEGEESSEPLRSIPANYDLRRLAIPETLDPICSEFFMSLCDYVIITDAKKKEIGDWLLIGAPLEKQLNTKDEWSEEIIQTTRALFVHAEPGYFSAVTRYTWPSLRLVILGGGDNTTKHAAFEPFLEKHPSVHIWEMNNTEPDPRVRTLPLGVENTMWRVNRGTEPLKFWSASEREYEVLMTHCSPTNPTRLIWSNNATSLRDVESFTYVKGIFDQPAFTELIRSARAVVCPPGNGIDTHRHWETLAAGAYMVLHDNSHTNNLQREYPSLPILPIESISDIRTLSLPVGMPLFHPVLLAEFWRILAKSHTCT